MVKVMSLEVRGAEDLDVGERRQVELFMELLGVSGEFPKSNLGNVFNSYKYGSNIISSIRSQGLIKDWDKGGFKTFRLKEWGKDYLRDRNPKRYNALFQGNTDTNHPPSTVPERMRVAALSEALVLMHNSGVRIYSDEKLDLFGGEAPPLADNVFPSQSKLLTEPSFYDSRVYKKRIWRKTGKESKHQSIMNSKGMGVLLAPEVIYAVYNTGSSMLDWGKVEQRFKADIELHLCQSYLPQQYSTMGIEGINGILIGSDIATLEKYLSDSRAATQEFLKVYGSLFYITNDSRERLEDKVGRMQLKFLARPELYEPLLSQLRSNNHPPNANLGMVNDAITQEGRPVLFSIIPNIPRLIKFKEGLFGQERLGCIYCLRPQAGFYRKLFGERVELYDLDPVKVRGKFLDGR